MLRTLTVESDLRKLGLEGLDLKSGDVNQHITNHPNDIVAAAFRMLDTWCQAQTNRTVAYKKMCEALICVGMKLKIDEALQ